MWKKLSLAFALVLAVPAGIYAVTVPNTFANSTVADATKVNQNFTTLAGSVTTLETTVGGMANPLSSTGNATSGYTRIGDIQIAWGKAPLSGSSNTRPFSFTFPAGFIEQPTVTTGCLVNDAGYTFDVYAYTLSTTAFSGTLNEAQNRNNGATVSMNYTAVGRWR